MLQVNAPLRIGIEETTLGKVRSFLWAQSYILKTIDEVIWRKEYGNAVVRK
jgi:hypothetical protein